MERPIERIGPYVIRRAIGEGGMGTVYEAVEPSGRAVALKVLHPELTRREDARSRFLGEVRILTELVHPNVVRSYESGEVDGKLVLVLELLEGRTLRDELSASGRLPARRAAEIASAVAAALVAAHEREPPIVHRDLKPENLMIGASGTVKVMDFGIAKVLDDLQPRTRTTQIVGTAQYMSPEHADGRGVTARSDLYALGLILYEMIAGEPPFHGAILALLRAHAEKSPPPFADDVRRELPPGLEQLVMQLLSKRPEDRPASARATHAALTPFGGNCELVVAATQGAPLSEAAPVTVPAAPVDSPAHLGSVARRDDLVSSAPGFAPGAVPGQLPVEAAAYVASATTAPTPAPRLTPIAAAVPPRADTIDIIARLERKPTRSRGLWIAGGSLLLLGALLTVAVVFLPWRELLGLQASRSRDRAAGANSASAARGRPGGDRFVSWVAPPRWSEYRAADLLTVAAFNVPNVDGETTRMDVRIRAPSSGPIERVHAQFRKRFSGCTGCDAITKRKLGAFDGATYELRGTRYDGLGDGDIRPNVVGLGATFLVGETYYDVAMVGPERSVNAARAELEAFLQSMREAPR